MGLTLSLAIHDDSDWFTNGQCCKLSKRLSLSMVSWDYLGKKQVP
jgi:hypothetical protein